LCREQAEFLAFFIGEAMAVANLVVMGWQLLQQLTHAVPLPYRVDIRNLVLWQRREVHMHLQQQQRY
jgi:hypothetical protein